MAIDIAYGGSCTGGKKADMVINDTMASREHARIECRRGKFILTDMSTNGTRVNGQPIEARTWTLSAGDRLQAGRVVFVIQTSRVRKARALIRRCLRRRRDEGPASLARPAVRARNPCSVRTGIFSPVSLFRL